MNRGALDWALADVLPVALYVCDRDGRLVKYNRRAVEIWGCAPDLSAADPRFRGAYRIFRGDGGELPVSESPMAEVLRSGHPIRGFEAQIERPDGRRLSCRLNIEPLFDEHGAITGAVSCLEDLTEARRAADEVRQSREQLRAIVETTPECIKIVAGDGTVLHMNPAGLRMVEAGSAGDVEGTSMFERIAPEHRERWRAHHRRVCDGEKLSWSFDLIGLKGTRRQMETHAAPLRLPDGSVAQLAVTRDVTMRQNYERALLDNGRRMRELLEALPVAIYTTDAEGRITFYNRAAAELAGRQPELGADQWCVTWRLYSPDGLPIPHEDCPMAVALRENRPVRGAQALAERPDGTRVPFIPYPTPLRDETGKLIGAVNMLVDVSAQHRTEAELRRLNEHLEERVEERRRALAAQVEERRRVEAQLLQSQKMEAVGQLTGGVAHDFNNLLTAIMSNLDLIEIRTKEETVRRQAAAAIRAAKRGALLTHQLLAFSRKQFLRPRATDINELVTGLGEMLLRTLGGTVHVELTLADNLWSALIDPSQIESAILNLAINARDAMPEGGTVTIETANVRVTQLNRTGQLEPGDYVMVAVADTGTGMSEEVKARAFEPFFTTKDVGRGSGLGLSQVYGIALQSGGSAEIDTTLGRGTTVRIYLPRSAAHQERLGGQSYASSTKPPRRRECILVVDDDDDVREAVVEYLEELGYGVEAARSGSAALERLESHPFDLVVMDFAMPGMHGVEAGRLIRTRRPGVPILFVTGHADTPALKDDALPQAVLRKPFLPVELEARIRQLLAERCGGAAKVVPLRSA
ncbi:MAG TPA: PAS domain-containing protein [Stellaceae bacterium]|nr:PAS domain-containing protein [Stellaceae bacterium]